MAKMAPKNAKMAQSKKICLTIASQRATEKRLSFKEAELNMAKWINTLFSKHVAKKFYSNRLDNWVRKVDIHSHMLSSNNRFLNLWGPLAVSQRVIDTLMPKLHNLSQTGKRLNTMSYPYKVREELMHLEKLRQNADALVGGRMGSGANTKLAPILAPTDRNRHTDGGDGTKAKTTQMQQQQQTMTAQVDKDVATTPGAEVSAVQRRLAQVLVSPDKLIQLFRQHSVDNFARVVTGLYVQYERFDCPKPRVTIDRVEYVSLAEDKQPMSSLYAVGDTPPRAEENRWQRVRLHVARGDMLNIAQCQSPFSFCRFPFLLNDGNDDEDEMVDRQSLLNPLSDEIKRKSSELLMALISRT